MNHTASSAFAITTMVWVPTPGGTGGIEFAFTTIFTASLFGGFTIGFKGWYHFRQMLTNKFDFT